MSDQSTQVQEDAVKVEELKCELCQLKYSVKPGYLKHLIIAHRKNEAGETVSEEDAEKLVADLEQQTRELMIDESQSTIHCTESKPPKDVKRFACVLCGEAFLEESDLGNHLKKIHQTKEFTPEVKHKKTFCSHGGKRSIRCLCTVCRKPFTTNSNLRKHLINVHKAKMKLRKIFSKICPLCPYISNSSSRVAMHRHFEEKHNISLKWERHLFKSLNDFDIWKTELEANTVSSYIKHSAVKNNAITYHCHRSGSYKKRSKEIKRPKVLGSCKINAFCPSEIKVYVKSSGVEVYYLPNHVGHDNEINHLQLSVKDKSAVIAKLEETHTCNDDILSSFNKSVTVDGDLKRINLLRKHDIHNITSRYGLKREMVKKSPEPVSVQSFVKSLGQSNDVMLMVCKALGVYSDIYPNLKENDFLLIYMSKNQNRVLMKHGKGTVCVDYTTGKNFHLFTLSVLNDNKEGIPVAFMFTNKVEGSTLATFFEEIKRVCGTILCKVFVSDIGEMIYSAWTAVMGMPKERIFSTWHVLEFWRKNLDSKVMNKEKCELMYNTLQSLICELNEDVFLKMLNGILTEDNELQSFVEFFIKEFVIGRPYKRWAHSYGLNADINTSMSLENFNRAIKFSYMKGGKRQLSVEEAVIAALKLIMDKEFFMIFDMKLETLKQKRNSVRCRHKKSLSMDIAKVKPLGDMWKVFFSKKEDFYVVMRKATCESCPLQCFHCKTCYHEYMCSCVAYSVEKDMCEHIHLVVQSFTTPTVMDTIEIAASDVVHLPEPGDAVSDQSVMGFYFQDGTQDVCQIEILMEGDQNVNYETGGLDQGSYTLVETEEGTGTYSFDKDHFVETVIVDTNTQSYDDKFHTAGLALEPISSLQEQKCKLLSEFQQFLDTNITEEKQFDIVKRGLTRIMTRKWSTTRRKPLKNKQQEKTWILNA